MYLMRFVFPILCLNLFGVHVVMAEDVVMPPPVVTQSAPATADNVQENAPNLREDLAGPDEETAADVRSYKRKDGAVVSEYAQNGHVYKIKVQPAGDLPAYYLYDGDGDGVFEQRLPGGGKRLSVPTWVLKEF